MDYSIFKTTWGFFGLVADGKRLLGTFLPDTEQRVLAAIRRHWPDATEHADALPPFRRQVIDYFEGKRKTFNVDIDVSHMTPFRQAVIEACRRIPYGQTASYGDLARAAGNPGAARAAGSTMACNPLPLVVPCHRVLCSDGTIGGFSSPRGVEQKKRLLTLEDAPAIVTKASRHRGGTRVA